MKRLLAAAAIAVSSVVATTAPSFADSVTIRMGEPRGNNHQNYHGDNYGDRYRHHVHYDRCWKQPYHARVNHHEITKYRTVCR
jgi:hypothetical protein